MLMVLLLLVTIFPEMPSVGAASDKKDVKEIMRNLTDEQRRSLNELKGETGFTIHPDINVMSEEPVNVIVEFKQDPAKVEVATQKNQRSGVSLADAKKKVESSHKQFKDALQNLTKSKKSSEIEITHEYRDAFNGVAITVAGNAVEELMHTGIVKRIWKDEEVQLDLPKVKEKTIKPKMIDSIPQIGVDKLHDEKIKGKGIKVGVIDTGIDYNHPDLEGAYEGYRAVEGKDPNTVDPESVKGWDFVDNDADPMEETYKEWQDSGMAEFDFYGNAYYTSHGTHVSGTVAGQQANNVDHAVKGVAPEVDLFNYRVLGPYGSGQITWILAGIDKAVKDEMDVINLSLGSPVNDPLSPLSIAVNNAMLADVVTVVASGNSGPGNMTIGTPGTGALAIAVGASDVSQVIPTFTATTNGEEITDLQLLAKNFGDKIEGFQDQSYPIVSVGYGASSDFEGKDLSGKIALIERGELAFDDKIHNAKLAGAEAAIVYNNEAGQIPYYLGEHTAYVPSFRLSKADGEKLKEAIATEAIFTFGEVGNTKSEGDYLADFSSRGPVAQSYNIKPDVVAPGVAIYSTYPSFMNDPEGNTYDAAYARIQGTSMAAPHVAATAALILQENPDFTVFDVKAALMNTSVDLREDYSVYEVGAGRINAYDAVHAGTSVKVLDQTKMVEGNEIIEIDEETASLSFGSHYFLDEAKMIEDAKTMVVKNQQSEEVEYALDVEFLQAKDKRQDAKKNNVRIDLADSVTVPAGESTELEPTIQIPKGAAEGTYEGYIRIVNEGNLSESYQVPFAIRVTGKGIDYVELERPVITNDWSAYHPFLIPMTPVTFKLKSQMETLDIIINDAETGEPVGFVGSLYGASNIMPDTEIYIMQGFSGVVYPFTDNPKHPISDELVYLPEGGYTFTMVTTDIEGNTYIDENVAVVDNTPPEMTFKDVKPGIIEVDESMYTDEDGHHAVWVHTNVYDSSMDYLIAKGMDYDQSTNQTVYYENSPFPSGFFPVQANGDMKFGVLPEDIEDGPLGLSLSTFDMGSTARGDQFTFMKEGTEYAAPSYDKSKVKKNDEITTTLTLNNVKQLATGKFDVAFASKNFKFKEVKANEALKQYAKNNNLEIALSEPKIVEDYHEDIVTVGASLEGSTIEGISGDMAFLDITFEVIDDEHYGGSYGFGFRDLTYTKGNNVEPVSVQTIVHEFFDLIPQSAKVEGYLAPGAFLDEYGEAVDGIDLSKIGAKVYVEAPDGKKYEGNLDKSGAFFIEGIEVQEGDFKLRVEVPGHLDSMSSVKVAEKVDGDLRALWTRVYPYPNYAGDVNNDGVIDIMDVMRVVAQYGKNDDTTDINKDGVVDELDIRHIEENFMRVGKNAGNNKQPVEKLGKKGLNDFLQSLGLEPKE